MKPARNQYNYRRGVRRTASNRGPNANIKQTDLKTLFTYDPDTILNLEKPQNSNHDQILHPDDLINSTSTVTFKPASIEFNQKYQ